MATRAYAPIEPAWVGTLAGGAGAVEELPSGTYIFEWSGLNFGDVGNWLPVSMFGGKSVTAEGTFAGSTMTWEGTDEAVPTNPQTLHDPQGAALAFTAAGKKEVLEDTFWIRPNVTAGAASGLKARIILTTVARR